MPDDHEATHGLVLPFDTDDPEFTRGVEVGMLHAALSSPYTSVPVSFTIHATNCEMAMRLAEAHGCTAVSDDLNDDFVVVTFDAA